MVEVVEDNLDARQKEADDAATKRLGEYIDTAKSGVSLTKAESSAIEKDTKIDFAGSKFTKAELEQAQEEFNRTGGDVRIGTKIIKADQFKKDDKTKLSNVDIASINLDTAISDARKKKVKDKEGEIEKRVYGQVARGTGPSELTRDTYLFKTGVDSKPALEETAKSKLSTAAAKRSDDERMKGNKKAVVLSAADQIQETIDGLAELGPDREAEAEIERLKDYKIKLVTNQDNLKFFEGNDLFAEEIIQSKQKAAKIIRNATSTSRTGLVDSETAIKRELELAKRGVARSEFDSWNSELAAMASARPSEARRPEFKARKRKLEADIASANRNGVRQSDADIDAIEERLKRASIEVRKNEEVRGRAVQIERNAEGIRNSFGRAFQVKVEKAPAKAGEK